MNEKIRNDIALFRYSIISPLITGAGEAYVSNRQFFIDASKRVYTNYNGDKIKISVGSIYRWYKSYQKEGFDGLKPQRRSDFGNTRKLNNEIIEKVNYLILNFPNIPTTLIYRKLVNDRVIIKHEVSLSTIQRYVNQLKKEDASTKKEYKRYELPYSNDVWYADTTYGPYITIDGKKHRTYIMALIDDSSRFIVGVNVFLNDNFINLMSVIKSAVSKYGKPKTFSFDNGTPYKNHQMELLMARIGSSLNYCRPYEPTSKAKVERWFATLKKSHLSAINMSDFSTLDDFRSSIVGFVSTYNQSIHSSLNGLTPEERFFKDSEQFIYLRDNLIDTTFLLELERKVTKDNVIVIDNVEYEVDYRFNNQRITIRYSSDLSSVYVVDQDKLIPMKLLNKVSNSNVLRKNRLAGGDK